MEKRNIIVIGASAGGFAAIKTLVNGLDAELDASIFIVWHISPEAEGMLPRVLNQLNTLPAHHAIDREPIEPRKIYVAPPDRHLLLEKDSVRVTRGPKENRFRPAVDPLFRSAAYNHGNRVIGVILSGALDDGTSGLWSIKQQGGIAVVQEPLDAEVRGMPDSALQEVQIDYRLPVAEMAALLNDLVNDKIVPSENGVNEDLVVGDRARAELSISLQDSVPDTGIQFGEPTIYTCPECHGMLASIYEGGRVRFRCHTGHPFSAAALLQQIDGSIEREMWSLLRSMEENINLLNHIGDYYASNNQSHIAALYFQKGVEMGKRSQMVRQIMIVDVADSSNTSINDSHIAKLHEAS